MPLRGDGLRWDGAAQEWCRGARQQGECLRGVGGQALRSRRRCRWACRRRAAVPCRLSATVLAVGGDGGDDGFDALGVSGCGRGLHGGVGGVGLGLRMAVGVWARGWGLGPVGPDSASDSASVGRCRTHKAAGRPGFAAAPRARGDLRAELVMLARCLLEKGECKNAEGGDRSFWRQNLASGRESSSWFGGDPVEKIPKVPKGSEVQSFQSSVHSGTCRHLAGDRRVEAAAGVGRCWHRRAEGR